MRLPRHVRRALLHARRSLPAPILPVRVEMREVVKDGGEELCGSAEWVEGDRPHFLVTIARRRYGIPLCPSAQSDTAMHEYAHCSLWRRRSRTEHPDRFWLAYGRACRSIYGESRS